MWNARVGLLVLASLMTSLAMVFSGCTSSEKGWKGALETYQVGERRSGYTYREPEQQAIQNDDFANPGMIMVDDGASLWSKVDGANGKSCASCHNDAAKTMKGIGAHYPVFDKELGKMKNLEQQINSCRKDRMKAKPYKYESAKLLAMTTFVRHQSRGLPMSVSVDGDAKPFFEKGKEIYHRRVGQLDMSCANCHVENSGNKARADTLSEGQSNGFPTYRSKWQKVGSIHRRFRGCMKNIRATPFKYGSDEYVNLELYLAWKGRDLLVETPSYRN
jgi:sulfur-oxidizing protein SoxA